MAVTLTGVDKQPFYKDFIFQICLLVVVVGTADWSMKSLAWSASSIVEGITSVISAFDILAVSEESSAFGGNGND